MLRSIIKNFAILIINHDLTHFSAHITAENNQLIYTFADLTCIMQGIIIDTCKELEITVPACGRQVDIEFKKHF